MKLWTLFSPPKTAWIHIRTVQLEQQETEKEWR